MKYKIYEDVINQKLIDLGWSKENLKRDITFFLTDEMENLEVRKMDYVLCNDNEVKIAVIDEFEFNEKTVIQQQENLINYLRFNNIPFLIFINNNLEMILINTFLNEMKKIKMEEIRYEKLIQQYQILLQEQQRKNFNEMEV